MKWQNCSDPQIANGLHIPSNQSQCSYLSAAFSRILDVTVALVILFLATPLMLAIAILVKLDSPGPCIYKQRRRGQNGKLFNILKFRTMIVDAHTTLEHLLKADPDLKREHDIYRKLRNDPRVTKLGRMLRLTSLDELPQLYNVLEGSMSLVGPRPYLPEEVDFLGAPANVILSIKPGLTGLWQVRYRSSSTFDQRIAIECQYVLGKSIIGDLHLLLKTVPAAISSRRAC